MRRRTKLVALASAIALTTASPSHSYQRPGNTELVSLSSDGTQATTINPLGKGDPRCDTAAYPSLPSTSRVMDMSQNGRYAVFASQAENLVELDTNLECDVFIRDQRTHETSRLSVDSNGLEALGGDSFAPSISANGRYVVFASAATNLVSGDTNAAIDIFLHDTRSGSTSLVSLEGSGQRTSHSWNPSINRDGRYISYTSATSERTEMSFEETDVFRYDVNAGITIKISVPFKHTPRPWSPDKRSDYSSISATGRYVVFASRKDLVENDLGYENSDIYLYDVEESRTELISVDSHGHKGTADPIPVVSGLDSEIHGWGARSIDTNGRYVVFTSQSNALVPNDKNTGAAGWPNMQDVFVHDRETHRTERVSVTPYGEEATGASTQAVISPDGRLIAFQSEAANFSHEEIGHDSLRGISDADLFVHDLYTGALHWVSTSPDGEEAQTQTPCPMLLIAPDKRSTVSFAGSFSATGRFLLFASCADNLTENDENQDYDIFLRDIGSEMGVGGLEESSYGEEPPDNQICIAPEVCVPPGGTAITKDGISDVPPQLTEQGANLYGASLAYRSQYSDLFAAIELEHMPTVIPGLSPIFYGLRFEVGDKSFEVRATSFLGGSFGLFDCTLSPACMKVADLRGGYGTTGMRVVFSLPLDLIGLQDGGELSDGQAFSALGSYLTGTAETLDTVRLKDN